MRKERIRLMLREFVSFSSSLSLLICQELLPKFQISRIISVDKKNGYVRLTAEVKMMNTVTYGQVQTLVRQIPVKKLPLAYRLLADLVADEAVADEKSELLPQQAFLKLSLSERRRKMAEQAQELIAHYNEQAKELQD